jgi:putative (di)nucleoside polyphosphate hydrolase
VSDEVYFRAGVGLLVVDGHGRVLALERTGVAGAWQLPQGGLRPDETPADAARRELAEETGLAWEDLELLDEIPEWLGYELPLKSRKDKTGRGQVHKWLLLRHNRGDVDLATDDTQEFRRFRWVPMSELVSQVWWVRQPVYRRLAEAWSDVLTENP